MSLPAPVCEPDEPLAARAAAGDVVAFEELVRRHGGTVLAALERLGLDPHAAEDAAQEAWVKVFGALDRYERSRPFRPWLFGIALNQGRDVLRRRSARAPETGDEATLSALRAERDAFEQLAEQSAISVALDAVEEPFREALVLVDVVGFGYEDAADTLGCALGTVKSRVHRGRESFRAAYTRAAAGATARQTSAGKGTGSDQGERNAPKAFGRSVT